MKGIDFLVVGLPQCGTTWTSVWLGGAPGVWCLHDPLGWARGRLERIGAVVKGLGPKGSGWWRGAVCSGTWAWPQMVEEWARSGVRVGVLVRRDGEAMRRELEALGLPPIGEAVERAVRWWGQELERDGIGRLVEFEELVGSEEVAREFWGWVLPGVEWRCEWWRELRMARIEPYWPAVAEEAEKWVREAEAVSGDEEGGGEP